jgi:hypothetical protein
MGEMFSSETMPQRRAHGVQHRERERVIGRPLRRPFASQELARRAEVAAQELRPHQPQPRVTTQADSPCPCYSGGL